MARQTPVLTGRRVLITGAARGIGAALAVRLHERGAGVAYFAELEPDLLADALAVARREKVELTTPQPGDVARSRR